MSQVEKQTRAKDILLLGQVPAPHTAGVLERLQHRGWLRWNCSGRLMTSIRPFARASGQRLRLSLHSITLAFPFLSSPETLQPLRPPKA